MYSVHEKRSTLRNHVARLQPVPDKIGPEIVIGLQIGILNDHHGSLFTLLKWLIRKVTCTLTIGDSVLNSDVHLGLIFSGTGYAMRYINYECVSVRMCMHHTCKRPTPRNRIALTMGYVYCEYIHMYNMHIYVCKCICVYTLYVRHASFMCVM